MKFAVKGHGLLEIEGLTPAGLPAMRLVQYHAPNLTVNAHNGVGMLRVKLADIDLRPSFTPPAPLNTDRDQLSRLGGSYDANGVALEPMIETSTPRWPL